MRYSHKLMVFAFLLALTSGVHVAARQENWSDPLQPITRCPAWLKQGIVMVGG